MNKRMAVTIIGLIGICSGMVLIIVAAQTLLQAEVSGIFSTIAGHSSYQKIAAMSCPLAWPENKPGPVNITIKNPLDKTLTYGLSLSTYSGSDTYYQQEPSQTVIIPANRTAVISWSVGSLERSTYFVFVEVKAVSDEDSAQSAQSQYHIWSSSFSGTCAIRLANSPEFTSLKRHAAGGLFAAILGSLLVYFARRPLTRRQRVGAVLIGIVLIVVTGLSFFYIFVGA